MNSEWFECKIRYDKLMENGTQKKTTETYLVDALTFTEAERRILEEMRPLISGDFTVTDIKRARLSEVVDSQEAAADKWFKCKVAYITLDERTGAEKRTAQLVLVHATDFRNAVSNLDAGMKGTLGDWVIVSITETTIMDVFFYKQAQEKPQPEHLADA